MKQLFLISLACLFLATSCRREKSPDYGANPVDLSSLKSGQQSAFVGYSKNCGSLLGYTTTGDTLLWSVSESNGNWFFEERFTEHSVNEMEPVSYPITIADDYILMPERWGSRLFFFYGNDSLRKAPPVDVNLSFDGCLMNYADGSPFIGDEIGHNPKIQLGVAEKKDMTVVACVPGSMVLDAFLAYDTHHIEISHTITQDFNERQVNGWYRID